MKTFTRNLSIALSALVMSGAAVGLQNAKHDEYTMVAFENCEIVYEQPMTQKQIDAYLALKNEESLMELAEGPIKNIEEQIEQYTDQIEELTKRAIQEDGNTLFIDKRLLEEQQEIVDLLDDLMDSHEADFENLEIAGDRVGEKAEAFEDAIEESLEDIDYDQINIRTPDSKKSGYSCYKGFTSL